MPVGLVHLKREPRCTCFPLLLPQAPQTYQRRQPSLTISLSGRLAVWRRWSGSLLGCLFQGWNQGVSWATTSPSGRNLLPSSLRLKAEPSCWQFKGTSLFPRCWNVPKRDILDEWNTGAPLILWTLSRGGSSSLPPGRAESPVHSGLRLLSRSLSTSATESLPLKTWEFVVVSAWRYILSDLEHVFVFLVHKAPCWLPLRKWESLGYIKHFAVCSYYVLCNIYVIIVYYIIYFM